MERSGGVMTGGAASTKNSSSTGLRVDPDMLCCGSDPLGRGVFLGGGSRGLQELASPWIDEQERKTSS